jgi:hydrogenase nickel incorporation protein HypB
MHQIHVGEDLRDRNREIAEENRGMLRAAGVFSLNIMSAPGAGKTSLLVRSIPLLSDRYRIAVIEGDLQTTRDAERVGALGIEHRRPPDPDRRSLPSRRVDGAFGSPSTRP